MTEPDHVIPFDRLPEGFARRLEASGDPAPTRPAATVVLLREGGDGLEALLVKRARSAGFVPGAFVFPGGRVDLRDGDRPSLDRLRGVAPEEIQRRMRLGSEPPGKGQPPAAAFVVAAIREAFEETGILLAVTDEGEPLAPAIRDDRVESARRALLEGATPFSEVLEDLDAWMDGGALGYMAHWITPEAEPRRYDTRFFAARVPAGTGITVDHREITEGVWLAPARALGRNRKGTLPMVFPTVKTLEGLLPFSTPEEVLEHHRDREIPAILPRLVRTPTGVGLRLPESE